MMADAPQRPIPDAAESIRELVGRLLAVLDGFEEVGEVTLRLDILNVKDVLTIHIALPPLHK
jgi:hypothetical protein